MVRSYKTSANKGFINLETYATAVKEVKNNYLSVCKAANACNINFMPFQRQLNN